MTLNLSVLTAAFEHTNCAQPGYNRRAQPFVSKVYVTLLVQGELGTGPPIDLAWGPRICIPDAFPGDADAAGRWTTPCEPPLPSIISLVCLILEPEL